MTIRYWWWLIFWSVINVTIVLFNFITDKITWMTWLNATAAVYLALRAGSYPVNKSKTECSEE